jgi:thiamine-phosphate diphosphorylase
LNFSLPSHYYAIVDPIAGHDPVDLAAMLVESGARILQLRMKDAAIPEVVRAANAIAQRCHKAGALFIVNDRADVALLSGADGVHLGQTDLPGRAARRLLGSDSIIGLSTHNLEQARHAQRAGADYIGFGPIYPGGAKNTVNGQGLERLREVRAAVSLPIVAIGGITEITVPDVLGAGADAAAIISDVAFAPDIPSKVRAILDCAAPR